MSWTVRLSTCLSILAVTVSVLAVSAQGGPQSVQELIARAKAAPGKLNYGAGTITAQLMGHRFHKAAGLDIVYVPFKGTPETLNGLLTNSVDIIYASNVTVGDDSEGWNGPTHRPAAVAGHGGGPGSRPFCACVSSHWRPATAPTRWCRSSNARPYP